MKPKKNIDLELSDDISEVSDISEISDLSDISDMETLDPVLKDKDKGKDKLEELKRILNNHSNKSSKKSPSKTLGNKPLGNKSLGNKSLGKKPYKESVSVTDMSYIGKKRFDEEFRGWGFTFFQ